MIETKIKPKIELEDLYVAIGVPTQDVAEQLKKVYECAGRELVSKVSDWSISKGETTLYAWNSYLLSNRATTASLGREISADEFYKRQGITPEKLNEINNYFE